MKSRIRCPWVPEKNDLYIKYHDEDWGVQVHDDKTHFEFLTLEGAQAGLSWESILKRRQGYRRAFDNFDVSKIAEFDEAKIERLMLDEGIIRNRMKIKSAINNASRFIEVQKEFGTFDKYIWSFVNNNQIVHSYKKLTDYPVYVGEAEKLSKDLKRRGFSFVGPTIMYAHMQACGLVNDHTIDCFRFNQV